MRIKEGSGGREHVGTAFIARLAGNYVLVSAEHTVAGSRQTIVGVSEIGAARWPTPFRVVRPLSASTPDADVAYAYGANNIAAAPRFPSGIPIEQDGGNVAEQPGTSFLAAGYPLSRGGLIDGHARFVGKIMYAACPSIPRSEYAAHGLDPAVHLATHYRQEARVGRGGIPITGAAPRGMSGGVLFLPTRREATGGLNQIDLAVAGILTEYHAASGLLVATRVEHLVDAVNSDLRSPARRSPHPKYRGAECVS